MRPEFSGHQAGLFPVKLTPPWSACAVMNDPEARPTQPQRQLRRPAPVCPRPARAAGLWPVWSPRSCRRPSWRRSAHECRIRLAPPSRPAGTPQPFPTPGPGPPEPRRVRRGIDDNQAGAIVAHQPPSPASGALRVCGRQRRRRPEQRFQRLRAQPGAGRSSSRSGPGEGVRARWRPTCRTPRRPVPCSTRPRSIWAR